MKITQRMGYGVFGFVISSVLVILISTMVGLTIPIEGNIGISFVGASVCFGMVKEENTHE